MNRAQTCRAPYGARRIDIPIIEKRRNSPIPPLRFILFRLTAFAALFLSTVAFAQSPDFPDFTEKSRWVHFTASSGFPGGEITGIFESSDSTLWVSTLNGLAWYDGFRWRTGGDERAWPPKLGVAIQGEYQGNILVRAPDGEYLGGRRGFRLIMKQAGDNLVFIGSESHTVKTNAALYALYCDSFQRKSEGNFCSAITAFFPTKAGNLWLTRADGLYRWDGKAWIRQLATAEGRSALGVAALTENANGSGLCLVRYPAEQMGMWEWTRNGPLVRSKLEKAIFYMAGADIDGNDDAVAVAQTGETSVRHMGQWKLIPFFPENARNIARMLFRRNGDLCVGSEDGLFLWRRTFNRWTALPRSPIELKNYINEILLTRSGDLWIASANGIEIRHRDGSAEDKTFIGKQRILNITGLQEDADGNIWISSGSSFDGAYKWDGRSWTFSMVTTSPNGMYIHKIRKDRRGRLWFLGLGEAVAAADSIDAGAYVLDGGTFTRWGMKEGLPSGRVYAFDETDDGALWFGTHKGLSRFRNGRWTHWSVVNGLRHDHVFCLAADRDGGVWFGHMASTGLGHIDRRDSVRYFTTEDGLADNRIYDIRVDSAGAVWITSQGGLCCHDHGTWSTFDEKSGLVSNALWPVLPLHDSVMVGTIRKGVAVLHRAPRSAFNPVVAMAKPIVENQDVFIRWEAFTYYGEVAPEQALTRYRVNGGAWSPWSAKHEASFRALDPGSYSIGVQAKGLYGQFDAQPEEASFTVLPPLHRRPVIFLPAGGAAAALLALIVMQHLRRKRHRKELEKSEERYRLITELMSDYAYLYRVGEEGALSVQWITDSFTRLTGYPTDEFTRPDFIAKLHHPDDLPSVIAMFESVRKGNPQSAENRIVTKTGEALWLNHYVAPLWDPAHARVTHIYGIARDITRRKHDEEQMRTLAAELTMTEERERRRMAAFLHDTISQTLAFTKIKIRTLERSTPDAVRRQPLAEIRSLIEESLNNTRSLTFELSPPALHELGVAEALRSLAHQLFEQHGIRLRCAGEQPSLPLSNEMGVALYYAVREVFINIIKHAQASDVDFSICAAESSIAVSVHDNGVGIPHGMTGDVRERRESFGLFNIRKRLEHLGGSLTIRSASGEGTTVVVTMPANPGAV